MQHPDADPDHHDGASAVTPEGRRRPGEVAFAALMVAASLALLWNAYGISGFEALSAPGSVQMATTLAMLVTSAIVLVRTARLPLTETETLARDILPARVVLFVGMLVGYGLLLKPLGFLPTSALFLVIAIRMLSRRGMAWTLMVALGSLVAIWLVFRIIFTVLMPAGIVPEAEIIQFFRTLVGGLV